MSPSLMKDRCVAFGIYEAPAQLSKQEFDAKLQQLADDLIEVPSIQKHVLKFDLMLPTNHLDEYFKTIGIPPPTPLVIFRVECESPDYMAQVFSDTEFQRVLVGGAGFDLPKGSWFTADVVTRIDSEVSTAKDHIHAVVIAKVPHHIAIEQFREQVKASHDAFFSLPVAQKVFLRHILASPNDALNAHIQTAGLTVAEPTFIVYFEAESVERVMELVANAESAKSAETGMKEVGSQLDNCGFSADVVTKINS
ncbi:hypothetical protein MVEN_02275300 [Mycena venus]|uniref:EthD domain-containing protein n=1 Tax=Mycena venus TaxID=2733690 RepID=A0A8H6X4R9_9AGAR|nr:hypothetical protein MVEN_02275300 [Mycena venus]